MNKWKKVLLIGKVFISLACIYLVSKKVDVDQIYASAQNADWAAVYLAFFIIVLNFFLSGYRWHMLILSKWNYTFLPLLKFLFVSHAFNMFIPGSVVGDIYRAVKTDAATIVMDRMVGMIGLAILWLLGLTFSFSIAIKTGLFQYVAIVVILLCLFSTIIFSRRVSRKFRWVGTITGPFREKIRNFVVAIQLYREHPVTLCLAFIVTLISHLLLVTAIYLVAYSLRAPVSYFYCLLFVPIIGILSSLPVSFGGLGIREASFILLFSAVGVPPEVSISISLLFYSFLVIIGLFGLGLSFVPPSPDKPEMPCAITINPTGDRQ